jgi:4-methylaminobutanoate oxidase (formaldehyde-forming)
MALPNRASVVVIGGGVLGTSAAFHLAESGLSDVVLLDRGPLACGTTPFAAGQTGHLRSDRIGIEFTTYCVEFLENFEQRTGHAIDFRQVGSLRVALTNEYRADLDARLEAASAMGQTADFITAADAQRMVPPLQLDEAAGILHVPRDGFVEPKSVAVGFAAGAVDRGVRIHTHVAVTGIDIHNECLRAVHTSEGTIETDWAVVAAGAWTRQLGGRFGIDFPAVPVRHQAYVTAPIKEVNSGQPIVRITEPQLYVRCEAGGLLVGGYGYRPLSFDMNEFDSGFEIAALPADPIYHAEMSDMAARFFPQLRQAAVVQVRRGLPTMSPDGRHIVSEISGVEGVVLCSACCVGGVHGSPGIGRIVADIVTGRPRWTLGERLSAERFDAASSDDAALRAACESVYATMYRRVL